MLEIHHLENSQSIRILWLLEELDASYKLIHYRRDVNTSLAPETFKKLHIIGTSPCVSDGVLVLPETNAIMDYVMDKFGDQGLRPSVEHPQRNQYLYWFHAAQGSLMPLLTDALIFKRMISKVPFIVRPLIRVVVSKVENAYLKPRLERMMQHIEKTLQEHTWFAGEQFTAADIVMGYCMDVAAVRVGMGDGYPNAQRFLRQMRARPSFQRALAKNGEFRPLAE